jgi:predicted deacylase
VIRPPATSAHAGVDARRLITCTAVLVAALLLAVLVCRAGRAMPQASSTAPGTFAMGDAVAGPGERSIGHLKVPDGVDPGTSIPITVIRGARPGPVLALIAGVHGSEYAPILAMQALPPKLDPKALAGTVLVVHVANPPSFLGRTIYYGPDGKNLNRVFPGKADGTISERIAHVLTTQVIERADVVIDIHCGDNNESLIPYTGYAADAKDPSLSERSRELALAFGIEHINRNRRSRPVEQNAGTYLQMVSEDRGKTTLAVESGELGRPAPEDVARIERGVMSVLRHLKMIDGEPGRVARPRFVDRRQVVTSPATGIFYPRVGRGDAVDKDQVLGRITDLHGREMHVVRAPFAGTVFYVVATPPIREGEPIAMIGQANAPESGPGAAPGEKHR